MAIVESDFDIYGDLDDALQPLTAVSNTSANLISKLLRFLLFYC